MTRHGGVAIIRYYLGANTYARDARPLDLNDPVTIPESADASRGDDRVSTYTQVVLESEIDRSDTTLRAPMHPWTEQQTWVERVEAILGGFRNGIMLLVGCGRRLV